MEVYANSLNTAVKNFKELRHKMGAQREEKGSEKEQNCWAKLLKKTGNEKHGERRNGSGMICFGSGWVKKRYQRQEEKRKRYLTLH